MRSIRLYILQPLKASMLLGLILFLMNFMKVPHTVFSLLFSLLFPVLICIGVIGILFSLLYFVTWMTSQTTEL